MDQEFLDRQYKDHKDPLQVHEIQCIDITKPSPATLYT